ncbi:carboxypeptidase M32, partial [Candidatus Poribacteria bacterium]|nr:carboxypeptidase M32 [Candidatus Poribacteria bacterium]
YVKELAEAQSRAFVAWHETKPKSDFRSYAPYLQKMLDLAKRAADYLGFEGSPYNALLEQYERGMTAERLKVIFGELAVWQKDLVARIVASPKQPGMSWTRQNWDESKQWAFTERVLRDMGYDFDAGRQDKAPHPFCTTFDIQDVRVTTRLHTDMLFSALSSSMHEGGHALYEQGYRLEDRRTTLANAPSLGLHESQSRMWENVIGRSKPFWQHYLPILREHFPGQLDGVTVEQVYAAHNEVRPSLIRVDADEVTYNLHVIIRFELELDLIEDRLKVADLPEVWNAKYKEYLGIDVPDNARGVMQDVHWAHGSFGYFPTYALGNLYAAQLFEKALADLPSLWDSIARGDMSPLREWLRKHVHRVGRRQLAPEIVRSVTGRDPDSKAYMRYLEGKYGAIYGL